MDGLTAIDYFVVNTQDTVIRNIIITVTLEDGSTVTRTVPADILPGESRAGTAYLDLSGVKAAQKVSVSVCAENQTNLQDCTVTAQAGFSDVSVAAGYTETADWVEITADLKNHSRRQAKTVLYLYGDEKKASQLGQKGDIALASAGSSQVRFTVDKKEITYNKNNAAYLMLETVTADGDYCEDNNTAYLVLYRKDTAATQMPPAPSVSPVPAGSPAPSRLSDGAADVQKDKPQTGQTVTVGRLRYKITGCNPDGTGEVALTGTSRKKSDRKFTSLNTGDVIRIQGKAFQVTAVGAGAFRGCSYLESVTIGKNVRSIGRRAFYQCRKLGTITIRSKKLTSVGKQAVSGIYKKAKIRTPKGRQKKYKKLFAAKAGYKKTMKIR